MGSIKNDLDNFNRPFRQMLRNLRDNVRYAIPDALGDMAEAREERKASGKKGCLWPIIKWYFILCCAIALLQEFGFWPSDREQSEPSKPQISSSEVGSQNTSPILSEPTEYQIPKFYEPGLLEDRNLYQVDGLAHGRVAASVMGRSDSVESLIDLETGKEIAELSTFVDATGMEYGYLRQVGSDVAENAAVLDLEGNPVLTVPGNDIEAVFALWEKNAYIGKRSTISIEYSGYEYALISFDGQLLTNWILEPTAESNWLYLGSGIFYAGEEGNTYYAVDMYSGTVFQWPRIEYMPENAVKHITTEGLLPSTQWNPLYTGNGRNTEFALRGMSGFSGDGCIAYLQGDFTDMPLIFYRIDRAGNSQEISRVQWAKDVAYVENLDSYVCVSYEEEGYYRNLSIYDMYGNSILNLGDARVTGYELGDVYILIAQENTQGSTINTFYSIYDYQGNQIHAPFPANNCKVQLLPELGCYALIGDNDLCVYTMDDTQVYRFEAITAKDKSAFFGSIKRTYRPVSLDIYDGYYVLNCQEDAEVLRSFIGRIEYTDQTPGVTSLNQNDGAFAVDYNDVPAETAPPVTVPPETVPKETAPPATEPSTGQAPITAYVIESSGGLNIRSGPGVDYEQVGRLAPNEKVVILNTQQVGQYTWGQIHNGWIRMDYITYEEPTGSGTSGSSSVRTGYVIESSGGLKVRSGPGQDYAEIGRLAPNDQVTVYESTVIGTSNWGRIGDGQWVCTDYVVFSDDTMGTANSLSFNSIPKEYIFTSGAGGWGTNLTIANDGSFTGNYHDSEMGVVGEGYPSGTVYYCNFSGKFSTPIKVNDYTYKMKLEIFAVADPVGYKYIQNEVRYIASEPYGFDGPNEYYIYLPGIPSSMMPQSAYEWVNRLYDATYQVYVICSAKGELPFMGTQG